MDNKKSEIKAAEPAAVTTPEAGSASKPDNAATTTAADSVANADANTVDKTGEADKPAPEKEATEESAIGPNMGPPNVKDATANEANEARPEADSEDAVGPTSNPEETQMEELPPFLANNIALRQFIEALPEITEKAGYDEMWGMRLKDARDVPTVNTLIKFLRANDGNIDGAISQLSRALFWRKLNNPSTWTKQTFSEEKYKDLGFVTKYEGPTGSGKRVVITWNVYGAAQDIKTTFSDTKEFIMWRVALMELAIRELKMDEATAVIDYDGEDPYQMIQVHDYKNVSFLRMDAGVKKSSRETIEIFTLAYPELLSKKYFVNVPFVMGWVYGLLKAFLAKKTVAKFVPISNGANLAQEFGEYGFNLPPLYGGKGYVLDAQGLGPRLVPNDRLTQPQLTANDLREFSQSSEAGPSNSKGNARASASEKAGPSN